MPIFSGKESKEFWKAIRKANRRTVGVEILYDYGCKAQEIETLLEQLIPIAEEAGTDDSKDTTIELAKQALTRS